MPVRRRFCRCSQDSSTGSWEWLAKQAPSVPEQVGAYTRLYFVVGCKLSPHANSRIVSCFAMPTKEGKTTLLLSLSVR